MNMTEYFFLKTDEYAHFQKVFTQITMKWMKEWVPQLSDEVSCLYKKSKLHLHGEIISHRVSMDGTGASVTFFMTAKDNKAFMQSLTQSSEKYSSELSKNELVQYIYDACLADLSTEVSQNKFVFNVGAAQKLDGVYRKTNQSEVIGVCEISQMKIYILLDAELLKLLCARKIKHSDKQLHPVIDAFGKEKTDVRVTVGSTKIKLSELEKLMVGDVIVLDQSLDAPSRVTIGTEKISLPGVLMRDKGNRVIKLV